VVGGEQRQAGVVSGAQFVAVHDAIEVADRRPRLGETVVHALERHDQRVPAVGAGLEQRGDGCAVLLEQLANGGLDVTRLDGAEGRQRCVGQERVRHTGIRSAEGRLF